MQRSDWFTRVRIFLNVYVQATRERRHQIQNWNGGSGGGQLRRLPGLSLNIPFLGKMMNTEFLTRKGTSCIYITTKSTTI